MDHNFLCQHILDRKCVPSPVIYVRYHSSLKPDDILINELPIMIYDMSIY